MELPEKKRFLFLHADNPTQRRTRSQSLDSKVRRHLMTDIGRSRRKPPKASPFVTLVWHVETSKTQSNTRQGENSTSREIRDDYAQAPAKDLVAPYHTAAPYTTPLILHALSVFEKEWGEDGFSAYGFTLIMVAGNNAMSSTRSTNTFWFPFAFRKSAFLHHYQQIFNSPNVLIPLYRRSARELRSLALERSLVTIQCVESRLASSDLSSATSESVINAVLAMVCYNFTSLDFDQAMIHVKGMWMVIAARGGISTLETNQDLMLMISWVDITAALLHDTKPLFPLSKAMTSASIFSLGLEMLPGPLPSVLIDENKQDTRFMGVMSCIGDLNEIAALLQFELATKGDAIWDNEEQMGFLINPVTHHLLDQQPTRSPEPMTHCGVISEALRFGAIIWIIRVKRRCRSYPGTAEARISTLLKMLSSELNTGIVWNSPDLWLVRLWLLVLCSISEPREADLATAMRMIANEMREPRAVSWGEVISSIRQMPWVDIFETPCTELGQRLMRDYLGPSIQSATNDALGLPFVYC